LLDRQSAFGDISAEDSSIPRKFGFYIGGVIGGGWSHIDSSDPGLGLIGTLINVPVVQTTTGSSFIGGIEGGDRYQFGKPKYIRSRPT
jgi:hypothetical protein